MTCGKKAATKVVKKATPKTKTLCDETHVLVKQLADNVTQLDFTVQALGEKQGALETRLDGLTQAVPVIPPIVPVFPVPSVTERWKEFRQSWAFTFCAIGLGLLIGLCVLNRGCTTQLPNLLPNITKPRYDVNTPNGIASQEVSREPFRSDTASRRAFGPIFAHLDELTRTGGLTDFEGYYNEFGRGMQAGIARDRYNDWAGVWNRIAAVCHSYGNGATDLRAFNDNLQSAARVVTGGVNDTPGYRLPGLP
jgi:hypothetical protein